MMSLDKLSNAKVFENHNKNTLKRWCSQLEYFHYMRARAGHSCEGDSFSAHFRYSERDDLVSKLKAIGVELKAIDKGAIIFDPFAKYSIDHLDKIKYPIPHLENLEQPQNTAILGNQCYIWIQENRFDISISGSETGKAYSISENDFDICLILEKEFKKLHWKDILDKEIIQYAHCISREKYPEIFE